MIKAVIFDFDDTLCMTAASNYKMMSETIESFGKSPLTYEENKKTVGDPLKVTIANYYPDIDLNEFMNRLNKIRARYLSKNLIEVVPQRNLEAIDSLALEGKQLIIVTSRREEGIKYMMDPKHHLGSRITHFYHLGNNPYHKPDPRTFEVIDKEHGLKPHECVYVGDTLHDAVAAKDAGLHFIASLESGIMTKKDYANYSVDGFIKKLPEVTRAVANLEASL